MNAKAELRRAALSRRDAIGVVARSLAAVRMAAMGLPLLADRSVVSGYWPVRSEADPRPLLGMLRRGGADIALPVVTGAETLLFRRWQEAEPLVDAGFGTFGPPPTAPEAHPDALIVPLAAFDREGSRIGYGKGHFDRAIAGMLAAGRRPLLVGLAFAAQEVEKVPFEPHDIPLDFIVTEDERIAAPPRG